MKKILLVITLLIFGYFLIPVTYAATFGESVTAIFGADIVQSLVSGGSAALTTVASLLVMFRKTKSQVNNLGLSADTFLKDLKTKLELVASGQLSVEDFKTDMVGKIDVLTQDFRNLIADFKAENNALKAEILTVKEQYLIMAKTFTDILQAEKNIEAMLKIGFGNMKEMVENGYAKQIYMVGTPQEVSEDEIKG